MFSRAFQAFFEEKYKGFVTCYLVGILAQYWRSFQTLGRTYSKDMSSNKEENSWRFRSIWVHAKISEWNALRRDYCIRCMRGISYRIRGLFPTSCEPSFSIPEGNSKFDCYHEKTIWKYRIRISNKYEQSNIG